MSLEVRIRKKVNKDFTLDVNFKSEEGIFALLGSADSGKTLTLKCIAGLETPDEGLIAFNGVTFYDSIKKINLPAEKRNAGFYFTDHTLFSFMTVEQNIRVALQGGMHTGAVDKKTTKPSLTQEVHRYLQEYSLDGLGGFYPGDLSEGQKQRAIMARIMAAGSKLILLDEPFLRMEGMSKAAFLREMKQDISRRKIPAVFASDDRDEVYAMGNEICALKNGRSEHMQEKASFFDRPETVSSAILSGCENITDIRLIDDRHALSDDWGTLFCFRNEEGFEHFPENMKAIGIRASDFRNYIPKKDGEPLPAAVFSCYIQRVEEDLRDWNIYFKPRRKCEGEILWKVPKELITPDEISKTAFLYVENEKILRLN